MDDIVRQAIAKWPNVPHCYRWLALDERGGWRMRDERAQASKLMGDLITHPALIGFINRNYAADGGRWYFQNGPQRVYVDLEATPYIARTEPGGFILHTGAPLRSPQNAWMTANGRLLLEGDKGEIAQLDDRDLAEAIGGFRLDGAPMEDEALLHWLAGATYGELRLRHAGCDVTVKRLENCDLGLRFGFTANP